VPWFKVDDTLAFHTKTLAAGNAAMGLWVRAGAWSMQTLTDGFVPAALARQLGTAREAQRLVDAGLWDVYKGGFRFHEWGERQPTADDVRRAAEIKGTAGGLGNHKRWHKKRGVVAPDCEWCQKRE